MCHMKSDSNPMLFSFGFLDRNQNVVITYSRSKLARAKSATASKVSSVADYITETDMCTENSQQNSQMEYKWGTKCDNNMISVTSHECTLSNQTPKSICDKSINGYKSHSGQHTWLRTSQQIESSTVFSRREQCTSRIHNIKSKALRSMRTTSKLKTAEKKKEKKQMEDNKNERVKKYEKMKLCFDNAVLFYQNIK